MAKRQTKTMRVGALSVDEAVTLLRGAGAELVSRELLEKDIKAGAPLNEDGTLNILHYAAWLLKGTLNRT